MEMEGKLSEDISGSETVSNNWPFLLQTFLLCGKSTGEINASNDGSVLKVAMSVNVIANSWDFPSRKKSICLIYNPTIVVAGRVFLQGVLRLLREEQKSSLLTAMVPEGGVLPCNRKPLEQSQHCLIILSATKEEVGCEWLKGPEEANSRIMSSGLQCNTDR